MSGEDKNLKLEKLIKYNKILSYSLSSVVLVIYFAFISILAFSPQIFGILIFGDSITLGILSGLLIIFVSIILTFIYVFFANNYLDKLKEKIK